MLAGGQLDTEIMNELEKACWYATWCSVAGYKRATRKWLVDALVIQWLRQEYGREQDAAC